MTRQTMRDGFPGKEVSLRLALVPDHLKEGYIFLLDNIMVT